MIRRLGETADNIDDTNRTIYDVGWGELVARNLVAGMSRALGGLVLNILFFAVLGSILAKYLWPQLQSSYQSILNASQIINQVGQTLGDTQVKDLPLLGNSFRFDVQDLGKPGSEVRSIKLNASQLEDLLFNQTDQQTTK